MGGCSHGAIRDRIDPILGGCITEEKISRSAEGIAKRAQPQVGGFTSNTKSGQNSAVARARARETLEIAVVALWTMCLNLVLPNFVLSNVMLR